ncbi:MAG: hypothetical protein HQ582_18195 [Planctomycetes bacterium]|nr:hypothetical protein [Planctomycetota bacterium]
MRRGMRRFARNVGRPLGVLSNRVANLGGIMATAAAGGIALATRAAANYGDSLDKMSARTGMAVEELARLQHAADLSGTSIQAVEKGVKRMASSIFDADQGLAESVRSMDELGVSASELVGQSPSEQFRILTEALAGVTDASKRAALAQDVFGRAGTQILPMLRNGAAGLKAMKAEADRLGLVITADQATEAARFKDELSRVRGALKGLLLAATGFKTATGALARLTQAMVDFRRSARFRAIVDGIKEFQTTALNTAARVAAAWKNLDGNTQRSLKNMTVNMGVLVAFAKTGLLVPFTLVIMGLSSMAITHFGLIAAAVAKATIALGGFALGKAAAEAAQLDSKMLKAANSTAKFGQYWVASLVHLGGLRDKAGFVKKVADATERFDRVDVGAANLPTEEDVTIAESLAQQFADLQKQAGQVSGFKNLKEFFDSYKAAAGATFKAPPDPLGLGKAKGNAEGVVDALTRARLLTAPFRGFVGTFFKGNLPGVAKPAGPEVVAGEEKKAKPPEPRLLNPPQFPDVPTIEPPPTEMLPAPVGFKPPPTLASPPTTQGVLGDLGITSAPSFGGGPGAQRDMKREERQIVVEVRNTNTILRDALTGGNLHFAQ